MDIYQELGVNRLINAYGTVTRIGGCLMSEEVLQTMAQAAKAFVDLDELLQKAGQRIADILGADSAFITSGAAAGMTIATAACIAGTDLARIERLPYSEGMKNEIVALKCHRVPYDQAIRQAGGRFVEVGYVKRSSTYQVTSVINEKTAAIFYLMESSALRGSLSLIEMIDIAHASGIPIIVNAAAEIPPRSNLHRLTEMGADLVIFSGGKGIGGPQNSGLIIGRRDLVETCALNSNPNYSVGRPMKVSKEAIAGLVKAVEIYMSRDPDNNMEIWEDQAQYFVEHLSPLQHISVRKGFGGDQPWLQPSCIPRAYIDVNEEALGITIDELVGELKTGVPGIAVGQFTTGIVLNPHVLKPGEEQLVVKRIKEIVHNKRHNH
jgi:L-seryl-tRNA(Ser) seleniumtransferase